LSVSPGGKGRKQDNQQDNTKLQAETVSYIALNNKLQQERDNIQNELNRFKSAIQAKEAELDNLRQRLASSEKRAMKEGLRGSQKYVSERSELENRIKTLENMGPAVKRYHSARSPIVQEAFTD